MPNKLKEELQEILDGRSGFHNEIYIEKLLALIETKLKEQKEDFYKDSTVVSFADIKFLLKTDRKKKLKRASKNLKSLSR